MNVALFLIPKRDVVWVPVEASMRYAFLQMEESGYSAIPMLDRHGCYAGTITEGDLLRKLMSSTEPVSIASTEWIRVLDVPLRSKVSAVYIDATLEELFDRVIEQNFVPVQDSRRAFVGIVRRREVIEHCTALARQKE